MKPVNRFTDWQLVEEGPIEDVHQDEVNNIIIAAGNMFLSLSEFL